MSAGKSESGRKGPINTRLLTRRTGNAERSGWQGYRFDLKSGEDINLVGLPAGAHTTRHVYDMKHPLLRAHYISLIRLTVSK